MLLGGQNAVVTGAANGIGRAIAIKFASHGGAVVVADIDIDKAEEVAAAIVASGGSAVAVRADVRTEADVERCVSSAVRAFGSVDVIVNNAGVPNDAPLTEMTLDVWQSVVDVHLRGVWLGVRAAAAVMCPRGRGSIINMSSMSGLLGFAGQTNYSAAKAGIVGLTKAAAREVGPFGVRVNAIAPGTIRTDRTAKIVPEVWASKIANAALRREGSPDEVANVALFLASDMASYVSGTVLEVAGGRQ
jgi:3-oxoacyl-[acyl-carrier protein] reductase